MYRNTYIEINTKNIEYNIKEIIKKHNNYKYYFGVVKADCYGHGDFPVVKSIINAGCNYLAVATLEEALEIRNIIKDIPILCLGIIDSKYIPICIKNNITITISNIEQLKNININNNSLKAHIKINTGMNRLGINNKEELNKVISIIKKKKITLEGIYTHIYNSSNKEDTLKQIERFELITKDINLNNIPIVHIYASEATDLYPKKEWNFVFGLASYTKRVGVFSFARFNPSFFDEPEPDNVENYLLYRSCSTLVHEICHTFGIAHCVFYSCLMNGSNSLEEQAKKPLIECPVCLRKLQYSIGFDPLERYNKLMNISKMFGGYFDYVYKWYANRISSLK